MSKFNRYGDEVAELRANVPKKLLEVFDAMAISETKASGHVVSRTEIIVRHLVSAIDSKVDEAILITRLMGINPNVSNTCQHVEDEK